MQDEDCHGGEAVEGVQVLILLMSIIMPWTSSMFPLVAKSESPSQTFLGDSFHSIKIYTCNHIETLVPAFCI